VILLHAFDETSQAPGWVGLAGELQRAGYAVLGFDFRGHGQSTAVNAAFWKQALNRVGIRGGTAKRPGQTIFFNAFQRNYYTALANDIAAAKAFLDQKAQTGECNSANLVLIGAKEGAALGALWMNAEYHRFQVNRVGVLDTTPQGKYISAAVWLSIHQTQGTVKMSVPGMLEVPVRQYGVQVAFVYGGQDGYGEQVAQQCKAFLGNKKKALTGAKAVPGSAARGSALLADSPEMARWVIDYLAQAGVPNASARPRPREEGLNYVWRTPRTASTSWVARAPSDRLVRYDNYANFAR
jgi:pimeloyl-ACP methyl ester carboxylesterase